MLALLLLLSRPVHAAMLSFSAADGSLGFHAVASMHSFDGQARSFEGTFDLDTLQGQLSIPTAALSTSLGPRDERMREYLDVMQFPTISFNVSQTTGNIEGLRSGSGSGGILFVGSLMVRGVSKEIEVPTSYSWENGHLRLKGSLPLRWSDFGIPDPSIVLSTLSPELSIRFDVQARPPGA